MHSLQRQEGAATRAPCCLLKRRCVCIDPPSLPATLPMLCSTSRYGVDPPGKLFIGSKICSELLGKLLIDLDSMRRESMATLVGGRRACDEGHRVGRRASPRA